MPRKPKSEKAGAEILAPIPAEVLDQIVRDGPLTAAEVETATRRLKKALIERGVDATLCIRCHETKAGRSGGRDQPDLINLIRPRRGKL